MSQSGQEIKLWMPSSMQGSNQTPPTKISEVLSRVQDPIDSLKRDVHTAFSGINLRGIKSHDVMTTRRIGHRNASGYDLRGLYVKKGQMGLVTALESDDFQKVNDALGLFMGQIGLTPETAILGGIVLDDYEENVDESDNRFRVALLRDEKDRRTDGKSGLLFTSEGKVELVPEPNFNPAARGNERVFLTDDEREAYEAFEKLNDHSDAKVIHPYIAAALVNATQIVGAAIIRKQIQVDFFQNES